MFLGREHHLIRISKEAITQGQGMGIAGMNIIYGEMVADILAKKMLPFTAWENAVLRGKLALAPLIRKLHGAGKEKRFRKEITESAQEGNDG